MKKKIILYRHLSIHICRLSVKPSNFVRICLIFYLIISLHPFFRFPYHICKQRATKVLQNINMKNRFQIVYISIREYERAQVIMEETNWRWCGSRFLMTPSPRNDPLFNQVPTLTGDHFNLLQWWISYLMFW